MNYFLFKNDIVTGIVNSTIPSAKKTLISQKNARLLNGSVVDANNYNSFFIDDSGVKHIENLGNNWQSLTCGFNDELINDNGTWRKTTVADSDAKTITLDNKIIQAEADKICMSSIAEMLDYVGSLANAPKSLKDKKAAYQKKLLEKK